MRQSAHRFSTKTRGQGLYNITQPIAQWVAEQRMRTGILTIFVQHTSASLVIQENADPEVMLDLHDFFNRLVPQDNRLYRHTYEGTDDMPAHIRAALTQTHLTIPVLDGAMALGTWQAIYLFEHREAPNERHLVLHLLGE